MSVQYSTIIAPHKRDGQKFVAKIGLASPYILFNEKSIRLYQRLTTGKGVLKSNGPFCGGG